MKRYLNNQRGITLIEMMVVIIILGILSTIIFVSVSDRPEQARRTKAKSEISSIGTALSLFKVDNGFLPSTEQGLQALVTIPSTGRIPKHYPDRGYLPKLPVDPWGQAYIYICPGVHGEFDVESYGPDEQDGGEGLNEDIESWNLQ